MAFAWKVITTKWHVQDMIQEFKIDIQKKMENKVEQIKYDLEKVRTKVYA